VIWFEEPTGARKTVYVGQGKPVADCLDRHREEVAITRHQRSGRILRVTWAAVKKEQRGGGEAWRRGALPRRHAPPTRRGSVVGRRPNTGERVVVGEVAPPGPVRSRSRTSGHGVVVDPSFRPGVTSPEPQEPPSAEARLTEKETSWARMAPRTWSSSTCN
jgi:hypothetical protein